MTAEFTSPDAVVWMSNGAGESLYLALATRADRLAREEDHRKLAGWLRDQVNSSGLGMVGFSLEPGGESELEDLRRRQFLCEILASVCLDIVRSGPVPELEFLKIDRRLQLRWIQMTADLHDLVAGTLPPELATPALALAGLPSAESAEVKLRRVLQRLQGLLRWAPLASKREVEWPRLMAEGSAQVSTLETLALLHSELREFIDYLAVEADRAGWTECGSELRLWSPPPLQSPSIVKNPWGLFGGALAMLVNAAVGGFGGHFAALAFGHGATSAGAVAVVGVVLAGSGIGVATLAVHAGLRGRSGLRWLVGSFLSAGLAALAIVAATSR